MMFGTQGAMITMAIHTYLPSLDSDGWINDGMVVLDRLFAHFLVSDYSQSMVYYGNVSSLPYLIYKHNQNFDNLRDDIVNTLTRYLERYYIDVSVSVTITEETKNSPLIGSQLDQNIVYYTIRLSILVKDKDGIEHDLHKAILIENSKVKNVMDLQ